MQHVVFRYLVWSWSLLDKVTGRKMTEIYWSGFKLPSILTRYLPVVYPMVAHTTTRTAEIYIECKNVANVLLVDFKHVYHCMQNQHSLWKTILVYFYFNLYRSMYQSSRLSICYIVKGSRRNDLRPDSPLKKRRSFF